jgi:uracil phosphoribosyltransferase
MHSIAASGSLRTGFWTPARLIFALQRGLPDDPARPELLHEATHCVVAAYAGEKQTQRFEQLLTSIGSVARGWCDYSLDDVTQNSSTAEQSRAAASRLAAGVEGPIMVLPLCRGGLVAAIQTHLYHQRACPETDAVVYPVSFSHRKAKHDYPQLTAAETTYMHAQAVDRTVVIYDEDAATGETMHLAMEYFTELLPDNRVVGLVSHDVRGSVPALA